METNCHSLYICLAFSFNLIFLKKWVRSGGLNWFSGPPTDPAGSHGFQQANCISGPVAYPNRCTL